MSEFKLYLLNEQKGFLAQKVGDVLTALQTLADDSQNMGNRQIVRTADNIVNQMRRILNNRWGKQDTKYLRQLQKVAVALAKAVDTNESVPEIVSGAVAELENLLSSLGQPLNHVGTEEVGDSGIR